MKILLFQWSQVSRHPEWKPYIDTWFRTFEVSVILKLFIYLLCYIGIIDLFFINFLYMEQIRVG